MLHRKVEKRIEDFLKSDPNKVLVIQGARQVGKSFKEQSTTTAPKIFFGKVGNQTHLIKSSSVTTD